MNSQTLEKTMKSKNCKSYKTTKVTWFARNDDEYDKSIKFLEFCRWNRTKPTFSEF